MTQAIIQICENPLLQNEENKKQILDNTQFEQCKQKVQEVNQWIVVAKNENKKRNKKVKSTEIPK